MPLASRIASASSSNGNSVSTGPNTSSLRDYRRRIDRAEQHRRLIVAAGRRVGMRSSRAPAPECRPPRRRRPCRRPARFCLALISGPRSRSASCGPATSFEKRSARRGRDAFIDGSFDQHAAAGRAGLAAVLDDRVDQHRQRRLEIGIGEDDLRRLAAELHRDAAIVDARPPAGSPCRCGRAGEGDVVDQRMRRKRRAGIAAIAGDDIEHAGRKAGFQRQFGDADRGQRGVLGRLDHQRVAHGKRGTERRGRASAADSSRE